MGGVEVQKATSPFSAGGKQYPAGTWVMKAAQPFRGYLVDLMEPQKYPEIRTGESGAVKRPYDLAGWTLSYQMGVKVDRLDERFEAALETAGVVEAPEPLLDHKQNAGFIALARALKDGGKVYRAGDGSFLTGRTEAAKWEVSAPRVALYMPWTASIDAGWTEWVLDTFEIPFTALRNAEVKAGGLRAKYDVVILAQQSMQSILHGQRAGTRTGAGRYGAAEKSQPRSEHAGGIGIVGVKALEEFVRAGGTLVAFDTAAELPMEMMDIGVRNALRAGGAGGWYCPGSLLRVTVDTTHPLAFGMPEEAIITMTGGQAFEVTLMKEYNKGNQEARPPPEGRGWRRVRARYPRQ
jgi:hypothetical protein